MLERLENIGNDELDVGVVEIDLSQSVGEDAGEVLLQHDLRDVKSSVVVSLGLNARSSGEETVAEIAEGVKSTVPNVDVIRRRNGISNGLRDRVENDLPDRDEFRRDVLEVDS